MSFDGRAGRAGRTRWAWLLATPLAAAGCGETPPPTDAEAALAQAVEADASQEEAARQEKAAAKAGKSGAPSRPADQKLAMDRMQAQSDRPAAEPRVGSASATAGASKSVPLRDEPPRPVRPPQPAPDESAGSAPVAGEPSAGETASTGAAPAGGAMSPPPQWDRPAAGVQAAASGSSDATAAAANGAATAGTATAPAGGTAGAAPPPVVQGDRPPRPGQDGFGAVGSGGIGEVKEIEEDAPEYAVQQFVLAVRTADTARAAEFVSEKARDDLAAIRDGQADPAAVQKIRQAVSGVKLVNVRGTPTNRVVVLRNSARQTLTFTARREGGGYKVSDLVIETTTGR